MAKHTHRSWNASIRSRLAQGMTLIEVLIALSLTAVVASLVGGLMQWYVMNQTRADNTFEQLRLARMILAMISDDLRSTVRNEPFDIQPLVELIQSSAGGGMGAGGMGGGAAAGGGGGAMPAGGASGGMAGGGMAGGGMASAGMGTDLMGQLATDSSGTASTSMPPGIYGSETAIEFDITRPPRPDQYIVQQTDIVSGTLTDLPSDVKTVSYFVQGETMDGVRDSLSAFGGDAMDANRSSLSRSGLVRRSIARVVLEQAYTSGTIEQINRTGELVAPEVVGLSFEYFNGTEWMLTWDSSTQGMPFVIRVTLALQDLSTPLEQRLNAPVNLTMTAPATLQESGVRIFSTLVPIPGAALATPPASSTDDGSAAMGL